MTGSKKQGNGLLSGVFIAYFILLLHVVLLAGLGCLVLFFRGFIQYMLWIFLGGAMAISYSGYRVYKRMKYEKQSLQEILALPNFSGRTVEVSLLGGLASLKVGGGTGSQENIVMLPDASSPLQIGESNSTAVYVRELTELAHLLEKNLITPEEYDQTKDKLLNQSQNQKNTPEKNRVVDL